MMRSRRGISRGTRHPLLFPFSSNSSPYKPNYFLPFSSSLITSYIYSRLILFLFSKAPFLNNISHNNSSYDVMNFFSLYFPIVLSLSFSFFLSFLLSTMVNLLKKNMHSVLALDKLHLNRYHHISSLAAGLGLIIASTDVKRPLPHVLDSVTVKSTSLPCPTSPIGFTDNIGHDVDGLGSCTEGLGFESSDETQLYDPIKEIHINDDWRMRTITAGTRSGDWRRVGHDKKEVKLFPPPLSSLNRNGRPCFLLRPVRKDGRLELFQVRIQRPEILHASREDGRLRLHLIPDENILDDLLAKEEEEDEEELQKHEEEEMAEVEQGAKIEEKSKEREEEKVGKRKLAMGSEGLWRCHEMVSRDHHHHHHLQICGVSIV